MTREEADQQMQELQELWSQVESGIDLGVLRSRIDQLTQESQDPNLWDDTDHAQQVMKKLARAQEKVTAIQETQATLELISEMLAESDDTVSQDVVSEIQRIRPGIERLWQELFFTGEYDEGNAIISIQAGAGGVDAQDFAEMITRMYSRFAERRDFTVDVVEYVQGAEAGIKRAMLIINGDFAYGIMRHERGVHRLVRISPFNAAGQRHTSFAMVQVLPELPEISEKEIEINPQDLKIDVYRSQGAGGQSVNTTDSAVRVTHIPSGIVVAIQTERSQLQNKSVAMSILKSRLWEKRQQEHQQEKSEHVDDVSISWGNHIRSYVLNPYKMVKDLRSNYSTSNVEIVLDGDLDDILTSVLISAKS